MLLQDRKPWQFELEVQQGTGSVIFIDQPKHRSPDFHGRQPKDPESRYQLPEGWYPFFYNVNHELQQKLMSFAMDLEGDLNPPEVSWKYSLIYRMFGWDVTRKVMNEYNKSKLLLVKNWDRLLWNLNV